MVFIFLATKSLKLTDELKELLSDAKAWFDDPDFILTEIENLLVHDYNRNAEFVLEFNFKLFQNFLKFPDFITAMQKKT